MVYQRRTKKEIDFIIRNYPIKPSRDIARALNLTIRQVQYYANKLRLEGFRGEYSDKEIKILKKYYGKYYSYQLTRLLKKRTRFSIIRMANILGLKSNLPRNHQPHKESTIKKMSNKRKEWYLNPLNYKKNILKAKKNSVKRKNINWEMQFGKEEATKRKSKHSKRQNGENNTMFGKSHSEETKNKIRQKATLRYANNPDLIRKLSIIQINKWKDNKYAKKQMILIKFKPTRPEKIVNQIIKLNNLPFNYVGDGKIAIGGFCPDFLSKNPKHIIEVNGDYWHTKDNKVVEKDKRKMKCYRRLGYKPIVIWEHEIYGNPQKVTEKIINFIMT